MSYMQSYQKTYTLNTKLDVEASVGIFTGCATDLFQKEVAHNCIDILKKNNIDDVSTTASNDKGRNTFQPNRIS